MLKNTHYDEPITALEIAVVANYRPLQRLTKAKKLIKRYFYITCHRGVKVFHMF